MFYLAEKDSGIYDSLDVPQPAAALQANQVVAHGQRPSPDHCDIHGVISGKTVIDYFVTIEVRKKMQCNLCLSSSMC